MHQVYRTLNSPSASFHLLPHQLQTKYTWWNFALSSTCLTGYCPLVEGGILMKGIEMVPSIHSTISSAFSLLLEHKLKTELARAKQTKYHREMYPNTSFRCRHEIENKLETNYLASCVHRHPEFVRRGDGNLSLLSSKLLILNPKYYWFKKC